MTVVQFDLLIVNAIVSRGIMSTQCLDTLGKNSDNLEASCYPNL